MPLIQAFNASPSSTAKKRQLLAELTDESLTGTV